MQEEVDQKTIALAVKTGKLTAQVLQAAIRKYLSARQKGTGKAHHGQQSLRQLKKDGSALSNIEITDANIGLFKPCAKKYDIDFIYSAPLDKDITLDEIYRRFNMEHPADYKGHSLSMGDIVVFRQDGKQTAYYVDEGADYRQVPEFFAQPEKQLTPDECMTGEQIQTPRGRFYLTDRSREQMEAAGYGFHHQSEDGRYLIMANGTRAFAIPAQPESHIKTAEMSTEQNYNMIDGMMNNAPSMEELEARAKAGEQISLLDVAEATKAEAKKPKQTQKTTQKQKKPSIRAQLAAAKEEQKKKPPAREKSKEMEV